MDVSTELAISEIALVPVEPLSGGTTRSSSRARLLSLLEATLDSPQEVSVAGGKAAFYSARSPEKKTANEDAAAIVELGPEHAVLIVADGVGGHVSGEHAAKLAIERMCDSLLELDLSSTEQATDRLRVATLHGIEDANRAVLELGGGAATTLAIVEIEGERVRPFHVGDSEILLTGQRGRIKFQTIAHSPVAYGVEAGLIDAREAIHHEDRHVISNVIGSNSMRIEIGPALRLARFDTLLLATDGLFDNLVPQEIVDRIRRGPLRKSLQKLVDQATRRMTEPRIDLPSKPDDLTVVAFRRSS